MVFIGYRNHEAEFDDAFEKVVIVALKILHIALLPILISPEDNL